ncbi:MAG: polysaccharide biosynthesis C-terminal domain-containing protein [Bacteroidetes bacterium]|nr:polysaccharide biosynthesis C-terminal domain-containing protein [Bacteroidota bacterium]
MARKSYFHDIVSVFGSNLAVTTSSLLIGIILSRFLGSAGYGLYSSLIVVPIIVIGFTQLGIRRATMYHLAAKKLPEDSIVSAVFILLLLTSLLSVVISGLVFLFSESRNADPLLLTLVMITIPLVLCNVFAGGVFLGKQEILRANILNAGPTVVNLVFVILLVGILKLSVLGAFLALLLGNICMFIFVFYVIRKSYHITWKYHEGIMKSMVKLGVVFALSMFIMQLNYRIDILLLKKMSTLEQIGLYTLATQIAEQVMHVPYAIEVIVMTRSAGATDEQASNRTVASIMRVSFLISIVFCSMIYLLAPFLIPLVFGHDFTGSIPMIRWILPGILMLTVFRILNSRLAGMGKPQVAIYAFIPALILNLILNIFWIPRYGAMGSVWATNASYGMGCVIFLFAYSWKVKMPVGEILRFRKSDFYFFRNLPSIFKWGGKK